MEHLECPSIELWNQRKAWFETVMDKYEGEGSYLVSEQACALIAETQSCFCAGAWVSVIVLAFTVIDAQLRETESMDYKVNSKILLNDLGFDERFQILREIRNRFIHIVPNSTAITVDQQWSDRDVLEQEARKAVELMCEAFYSNPSV